MTADQTPDPASPDPAATPPDPDAIGPATPPPPHLPEVEQESMQDIIAGAPSTDEIIASAERAEDVLGAQPSVDELLGRDRDERGEEER